MGRAVSSRLWKNRFPALFETGKVAKAFTLCHRILPWALATQVLDLMADDRGSTPAVLDIAQNPATASGAMLQRYAYSGYGLVPGPSGVGLTDVCYVGQLIRCFLTRSRV